ncbi:NAD-dependent epimerase/dehydratase family protein [Agitococcus lubricus]|uniref:Nucleoside-diphosphate-sugar epimerase n=1 Tax=Agitococcus lubricus TaxID=1077255 RepID=A0A2T5J324_9GAMM|nr:NAD-dependent epimerase/dehydratase family protein [Agitococcus lubricus]PTQ91029.1 nucleoside-diphosphate-sugar epimerase [Agitococcus lubricus]
MANINSFTPLNPPLLRGEADRQGGILLIGCGDVGLRLANKLISIGHQLTIIKRSPLELAGVTVINQDVSQPFSLSSLSPDYIFIILSPSASTPEAYQQVFMDGLKNIAQALAHHQPKRVFFVSSSSVFGQDAGQWVDEQTPPEVAGFNGQILLQAEALCLQTWPSTILRCAGIYGEGRLRLINWLKAAKPVETGLWSNRIHIEDVVGILLHLLAVAQTEQHLSPVYLGVDDCPVLQAEVLDWLAEQLALTPVPKTNTAPRNKRLSNQALKQLGYVFQYTDYKQGYRSLIDDSRAALSEF